MGDQNVSTESLIASEAPPSRGVPLARVPPRQPRVLFLARPFPPVGTTACIRTWNTAKYLARAGWAVTVVTPDPSIWRRIDNDVEIETELKREGIERILTGHRWRCLNSGSFKYWDHGFGGFVGGICRWTARRLGLDRGIGWVKAGERACSHLTTDDVDIILATAPPFSAFHLAKRLSDRLGRPYVLDYRDLWTRNAHDPGGPITFPKEARLLKGCVAVTTVSPSWGSLLDGDFKVAPKLHILTNGYDPEYLASIRPHEFGHFAIVYAGNFYPPKRVISPVMAALKSLQAILPGQNGAWDFHYYGSQQNHVCEEAKRFGVMERVVLHGRVSQAEAFSAARGAGVAVVIASVADRGTREEQGIIPGKLFELIGLGTPILQIAPPGSDVAELLLEAEAGMNFRGTDVDGMGRFLAQLITGKIRRKPSAQMTKWAWPTLVNSLDSLLRSHLATKAADR
jgi:glycosyltransferase involved in cell wall biosynthesis